METMVKNETKVCNMCNEEKELNEYYSNEKYSKMKGEYYTYYHPYCKECAIKKTLDKRMENYEEYLEYMKEYNPKYLEDPVNKLNKVEHARKARERGKVKEWQRNNRDKIKQYNLNRQMNKTHKISSNEWEECKKYFNHRCAYCNLAIEDHWIKFNGELILGDFHKEHVDHKGLNDLTNCVPACRVCNSSKHIFTLEDWYNEDNVNFTEERLNKIHKWLNEDYLLYIDEKRK